MDPRAFLDKWQVTQQFLATRLGVEPRTVERWTASPNARTRVKPTQLVLTSISLLDQLWEAQGRKPGQKLVDLIREIAV